MLFPKVLESYVRFGAIRIQIQNRTGVSEQKIQNRSLSLLRSDNPGFAGDARHSGCGIDRILQRPQFIDQSVALGFHARIDAAVGQFAHILFLHLAARRNVLDELAVHALDQVLEIFNIKPGDSLMVLGDEAQGIALMKGDDFLQLARDILNAREIKDDE
jgi:hypothetical protein